MNADSAERGDDAYRWLDAQGEESWLNLYLPMQLLFSRCSEVSIREQLATQVVLAILSGELVHGAAIAEHPRTGSAVPGVSEYCERRIPSPGAQWLIAVSEGQWSVRSHADTIEVKTGMRRKVIYRRP